MYATNCEINFIIDTILFVENSFIITCIYKFIMCKNSYTYTRSAILSDSNKQIIHAIK